jgi:hypothetical protein
MPGNMAAAFVPVNGSIGKISAAHFGYSGPPGGTNSAQKILSHRDKL